MENQKIGVLYDKGKNAKWYIDKYAGGFGFDADKKSVLVEYAGGGTRSTRGSIFKRYPIVENGATISIGSKKSKGDLNQKTDNSEYPNLRKGVIINVGPDGNITEEDAFKQTNGSL